jgi:hypothetical protein
MFDIEAGAGSHKREGRRRPAQDAHCRVETPTVAVKTTTPYSSKTGPENRTVWRSDRSTSTITISMTYAMLRRRSRAETQ